MTANKIQGIRAALCYDELMAQMSRSHNNANVLCLGSLHTSPPEAKSLINVFLTSEFEGGRHERRVCKFIEWENDTSV